MKWSLTICTVFGIRIRVHASFLLLVLWAMAAGIELAGARGAFWSVAFILATFVCVALHELGHSVVAQRLGVQVSAITLLPFGGVAALRSIPEKPSHEIAITVAGPAVNVVLFGLLFALGWLAPFVVPYYAGLSMPEMPLNFPELIGALLFVNKLMVLFNLIPAYPMDGGRLLRAGMAVWLTYPRATSIAAAIGQGIAVLFVVGGLLLGQIFLPVIGVLIYLAAGHEAKTVRMRSALREVRVRDVMNVNFAAVTPEDAAADCVARIYQSGQDDFPVMADGRLIGLLSRDALTAAVQGGKGQVRAEELMRTVFRSTSPDAPTEQVHDVMLGNGQRTVPVLQDGVLLGLLTLENIGRYCQVSAELRARKRK